MPETGGQSRNLLLSAAIVGGIILSLSNAWWTSHRFSPSIPISYVDVDQPISSITSWRIIGPFPLPPSEQTFSASVETAAFAKDYLAAIRSIEAPFKLSGRSTKVFIDLSKDSTDPVQDEIPGSPTGQFLDQVVQFPSPTVRSRSLFWKSFEVFKINYAAASLYSARDTEMVFLLSGNSPVKLWLNNEVIYQHRPGVTGYSWPTLCVKRVRLHKGLNFVLLKMFCFPKRNDFAFRIATISHADEFVDEHGRVMDVLDRLIVPQGQPLLLSQNLGFYGSTAKVDLIEPHGRVVYSSSLSLASESEIPTGSVPTGLYTVRVTIGKKELSEDAYIGSPQEAIEHYRSTRCLNNPVSSARTALCPAIPSLFNALSKPHQDLNQGMFNLLSQFVWDLDGIEPSDPANSGEHRIQLESFRSKVDNQLQYYYFYFPARQHDRRVPLVIICPTKHPDITFMDGPPDAGRLQTIAYYADKYGYAFILPYDRGLQQDEAALATTDLFEAIGDAQQRYSIDAKRLYLLGECASARNAILLAERFPARFAAVSAFRAATGMTTEDDDYWASANNALRFVENLKHVPVRLIYGLVDPHSPKEQGVVFQSESREAGADPELILVPGDGSSLEEIEPYRIALEFFNGKSLTDLPNEVSFSTNQLRYNTAYWLRIDGIIDRMQRGSVHAQLEPPARIVVTTQNISHLTLLLSGLVDKLATNIASVSVNGVNRVLYVPANKSASLTIDSSKTASHLAGTLHFHNVDGPISNAFADPFLVVQGTAGTPQQQSESKEFVNQIQRTWLSTYRSKCRIVLDKEVTQSELTSFNIIMVGKIGNNPALMRARAIIPFKVNASEMMMGDQRTVGRRLLGVTLYPNPFYPNHYEVAVDFNNAKDMQLPDLVLSGTYDGIVWARDDTSQAAMGQWYWDSAWKQLR